MATVKEVLAGKPLGYRIIDAHTHIGTYQMYGWLSKPEYAGLPEMLAYNEKIGVGAIVTAPHDIVQGRMEEANRACREAVTAFPGKIYGYISIVPSRGLDAVKKEIETYGAVKGFVGMKFLPGFYHGSLLSPGYEYAMDAALELNCPVLCHVWGNDPSLSELKTALKSRPELKLIVAHQGGGYARNTYECAEVIKSYPNARMELCGSLENSLGVEEIVGLVGEDKVIFGTDAVNLEPTFELGRVAFAPLSDRAKEKIFAQNYLDLLKNSAMSRIE